LMREKGGEGKVVQLFARVGTRRRKGRGSSTPTPGGGGGEKGRPFFTLPRRGRGSRLQSRKRRKGTPHLLYSNLSRLKGEKKNTEKKGGEKRKKRRISASSCPIRP